jgi:hypothetical protein
VPGFFWARKLRSGAGLVFASPRFGTFFIRSAGVSRRGETVTLSVFCLIIFSGTCSVTGQILFKHAMSDCVSSGKPRRPLNLAAGVLAMTVAFFTWLTLMQRSDRGYLESMSEEVRLQELIAQKEATGIHLER